MPVVVELVDIGPSLIAAVRRRTMFADVPRVLIAGLDVVWATVRGKSLQHGHNVAIYRPLGGNAVDLTCAVQVADRFETDGEVSCTDMPAGRTAAATHIGPYSRLAETHRAVTEWALASGHRLAGVSWEVYDHPVDDPEKLRTDVYMLLAPD
jgi:effector-binding domain-containing protein